MTVVLDGVTWEHPRAWRGLEAACASVPGVAVTWHRQSLAGFENEPVAQLAQRFDLLVVDHPGLGAAIAGDALVPLAQVLEAVDLAAWQNETVAATWSSYTVDDVIWALPLAGLIVQRVSGKSYTNELIAFLSERTPKNKTIYMNLDKYVRSTEPD